MSINLCDANHCTQCQACVQSCALGCITMQEGKDGFYIPSIDTQKCVGCGRCTNACHVITSKARFNSPLHSYACWTLNGNDRKRSSSGGAFSALARRTINSGGIVYGASMQPDLNVKHIGVERHDDIVRLQGSKYIQSNTQDLFKQVKQQLETGRLVLFSGCPCQVAALLTFLEKTYENLITCDLICHGVPSQKAFDTYCQRIGLSKKTRNFNFRFTEGWGFQLSSQLVSPQDGDSKKILVSPKKAYYLRAFTRGLMFGEACYHCSYARLERVSDFTLADYWGIGTMQPFRHPTHQGVSCLLVNTDKAEKMLQGVDGLFKEERPLQEIVNGNHNLTKPSARPMGRDTYYEDAATLSIPTLCRKYGIKPSVRDYFRIVKQKINSLR